MTVYSEPARAFLKRHGMDPESVDPGAWIDPMREEMERGLAGGKCSMEMIPTYLSNDGALQPGHCAAVIDAGGTNFRCGLVQIGEDGWSVSDLYKSRMPGANVPCTWEEFIRFTADRIEPLMDRTDSIGFCFSYSASVTPDMDARVNVIDKEVVVTGCEGQLIGEALRHELGQRGYAGRHVVILNDTVAVLLGGAAGLDKQAYSGFIGQVSGTGTNTCVSLPVSRIGKLGMSGDRGMIVNLESGEYNGIPGGDFDRILDWTSHNPGQKPFEKMTAGVYLGQLCRLMLLAAADEGLLSTEGSIRIRRMAEFDASVVDAWSCGESLEMLSSDPGDAAFARELSLALFRRSARCMCVNLLALTELAGGGRDRPMCVLAEGSLVRRSRVYRPELERLLERYGLEQRGLRVSLLVGEETTLAGSAAAVLLNPGKG